MINSELVRQLKTNQEKVDYLEKKDIERAKELASMQNEVEKHQQKVFEIEAKLNIESGRTMALTMQLTEKDIALEKLTSTYEQKLKEKEAQLVVMAKAQSLSNQRAITAEAAMNEFLANPLAGMALPGSPQDAKIQ